MFSTDDHMILKSQLDQYPVPMFAAQRNASNAPFYLICVNDAHSRATGLATDDIAGKRPTEFLTPKDGAAVEARYDSCIEQGDVINYREELFLNGQLTKWQTTLLPILLPNGGDRIIGTALTLGLPCAGEMITDAEYYAAQAQMRLGQIDQFLQIVECHPDAPEDLRSSAMMMKGLNRSMDHLLQDLRFAARGHLPARVDTRCKLQLVARAHLSGGNLRASLKGLTRRRHVRPAPFP